MAKILSQNFSVEVSRVVSGAIVAVKAVRLSEQTRREAEFQKAVAAGMSYKDQVKFREQQLEDEKSSSFNDEEYIKSLDVSIAQTKKLARFENIRIKYKNSLDDYITGKESISQHIQILEGLLNGEQDPDKQQELSDLLSSARKEKNDIEINAIKNRSLLAQKDNSTQLIDASISEVQSKRALASINQNDDDVAMWDDTLLSLRSAKSKLLIENGLNEIAYQTNRSNLQSGDKLNLLNNYVSSADSSSPVTYEGITYPSLKAYWENKRGEYISNSYFDDLKREMDAQTLTIASTNSYGQIPVPRIQAVSDFYNNLKNKPEFAPYINRIDQARVDSVTDMANNLYTSLVDEANTTGDYTKAETAILGVENRLGVQIARPAFESEAARNKTIANTTIRDTVAPVAPLPNIPPSNQVTPSPTTANSRISKSGDTLSKIASESNITLSELLDLNPKFKANPNVLGVGENINISPNKPATPPSSSVASPTPAPSVNPPVQNNNLPASTSPQQSIYNVVAGDTLSQIALKNNKTVAELAKINNIADPNKIKVGQTIKLQ